MDEKNTNILLVEDEESHADLICHSFKSNTERISVTVVQNLNEARNSISKSTPDLIIVDFLLPDGKGIELIPARREESPYPVIILTSHGDEKVAVEAMKACAFDYIVKSEVTLDNMPRICKRIMREWQHIRNDKKAEKRLSAQHIATKVLAESITIEEASPKILQAICTALEWDLGEMWVFDQQENVLRNAEIWHMPSLKVPEFIAVTRQITFPVHIGLPGRVWETSKPIWIEDVARDTNFLRASVAAKEGLHGAFGFPIISGSKILGTISFYSHEIREPDNNLLDMISAIGSQIGLFIKNKSVEKKHRESEERFRSIFEQAAVGIIHVDSNGQFLKVNKRFCEITGYTEQELLGSTFKDITHPDDLNMQIQARKRVLDGETASYRIEKRYIRKDGKIIWAILTVALIRKPCGEPDYFVSVTEDITERKKMEEVILQTEKLRALGVITSGVAHDFNNTLAIISGNTQLLQESLRDDKESADRLSTIRKAANDGAEIVRRMRKFMATEKDISEFISVNIKDVIEQSVEFTMPRWRNMAVAEGIKYDIDMKGVKEVPAIPGNPSELREVLINIINNALDVMPEGGTITVATRCVRPSASAESTELGAESNKANATEPQTQNYELKGGFVEITFTDTGTGMTEEVKEKIFDPFFTTKRAKGSGLGMSVSYGIIKSHDGNIEVESEDGAGSTFTLTLPIDREIRQAKVPSEQTHEIKLEKLRILVIDDEEEICSILEKFFTRNGHKVNSFMNCAEAIKILKSEEFDLVLCDLVMPDLTGHDVIEIVDKLNKKPKMGLITGWDEKIESKEKEDLKVDFIIKKPFVLSELTKQINELFI